MHMRGYILFPLHYYLSLNKAFITNLQFYSKIGIFDILVILVTLYLGQNCLFSFVLFALLICSVSECGFLFQMCFMLY